MLEPVPHFSTFGKNYTRRFKDTSIFEQIFSRVLEECFRWDFVDPSVAFVDATHIKACANKRKAIRRFVKQEALFYEEDLKKEIRQDREEHGKKPLKDDDDDKPEGGGGGETKEIKESTVDPESGLFHKGEHKEVFAYVSQTACDRHGWVLGYSIHKGNEHDSRTFTGIYSKLKELDVKTIVADAGYKTPAIARLLINDGITPIFPYTRPMTKEGFFRKYEYVYDELYDCYICPNNQILSYSTTNREGYREYKSCGAVCSGCPYLKQCTLSREHVKIVTRHVWESYMEQCDDIRQTLGNKELYDQRKETIERLFGTAKENHGLRYTQYIGKARMEMKVGLTFTCLNLKKLAKMKRKYGLLGPLNPNKILYELKNLFSSLSIRKQHVTFSC
jgi:hypothetical protein